MAKSKNESITYLGIIADIRESRYKITFLE